MVNRTGQDCQGKAWRRCGSYNGSDRWAKNKRFGGLLQYHKWIDYRKKKKLNES